MLVPPLFRGRIANIIDDLVGKTVIVEHFTRNEAGSTLYAFYAHIAPDRSAIPGKAINNGEVLGKISSGKGNCPAHLHISTAWCSRRDHLEGFSWADHAKGPAFQFFDPLEIL